MDTSNVSLLAPFLGWSLESLCDWKHFVSLSVSSTLLYICQWTCFEIGTIALGESLAAAVIFVLFLDLVFDLC